MFGGSRSFGLVALLITIPFFCSFSWAANSSESGRYQIVAAPPIAAKDWQNFHTVWVLETDTGKIRFCAVGGSRSNFETPKCSQNSEAFQEQEAQEKQE